MLEAWRYVAVAVMEKKRRLIFAVRKAACHNKISKLTFIKEITKKVRLSQVTKHINIFPNFKRLVALV
jgi:hypothetical protein